MKIEQIAQAVLHDPTTSEARARGLQTFIDKGADHWTAAVHWILPAVYAEMKKPIYEGVQFEGTAWEAAAEILETEIDQAIAAKQGA